MNIAEQQGLQLASILMISTPSKIDKDSARSHAFTKSLFCGSMSFHCRADDQMVLKIHRGFSQCFFSLTTTEIKENTHEHPYERFFGGRLFDEIVVPFGVGHLWNWKGRFGFGTTCFFLGHFCLDLIGMEKKNRWFIRIVCPKERRVDGSHGTRSWRESPLFRGFSTFRCETQTNKNHFQGFLVATAFVWLWFETCFSQVDTISACTRTPWVWLLKKKHVSRAFLLGGWSVSKALKDLSTALNLQKKRGAE